MEAIDPKALSRPFKGTYQHMKFQRSEQPVLFPRSSVRRITADPNRGLTMEQVQMYREHGWDNRPVEAPSKTVGQIIRSNVLTYFNLIFAILTVLLVMVRSFGDIIVFLPVIVINTLIGIIQELNAKRTLDKLTMLHAPRTRVLRNGIMKPVSSDKLVLDDIVIFSSGNQICADAIVVEGEVSVNEALLTGESDEITKKPGDSLLSGSFIVSGSCKARLEKVGADSYISRLTLQAKATQKDEQSEMVRSLNRLLKIIGIIIIPIGIILFYQSFFVAEESFANSVTSMVAAVIGMIPEGLYLLVSVTLAVSTIKLAVKKVLVHDMKCIETLARVDVLCVDKTGTITSNEMTVSEVIPLSEYSENIHGDLTELLSDFANAMASDNITMQALKARFTTPSGMEADRITSFSSANKYSSATFHGTSYVLGAPEFLLKSNYGKHQETIEQYSNSGNRVLVYGIYDGTPNGGPLIENVLPLALVLISNPVRKDALETFSYFAAEGVDIKVISGDNPITVSQVAKEAGIKNASNFIDASVLQTKEDIAKAVRQYTVFGRVNPQQKLMIIKALKAEGKTVAMTGDGVNDVLALKEADCSIAMASGSDAASQASQLVLLESDFSRMPDVVAEGRQVVNNLERSGSLFLVKNIFSLLISLFSIAFALSYPIGPAQISLISTFTIGLPGFLLSQVPNTSLIKGKYITNVLVKALPAGITDAVIVGALVIFGQVFAVGSEDISVAATMLLSIVGFMILYELSKPMNLYKWIIWCASVVGLILFSVLLNELYSISAMSLRCIMLFVVFSILTEPLLRYLMLLTRKIRNFYLKRKGRDSEMI